MSPSLISQVETGRARPSVDTLYAIATELGLSLDELLFPDPRPAESANAERRGRGQRELVLPKERILTLYLNVAEWGPGVFGIEAAARHHYGTSASSLSRTQASRLAAVLPNPLERDPDQMGGTASRIRTRMGQMGW